MAGWGVVWVQVALSCGGCRPEAGERESLVTGERVLAVRGEPPESRPGEEVTYDVLVASPGGTVADPQASWAFCAQGKALADNGSVSADCLGETAVRPIGGPSATVTAATPEDACLLFGPEVPPGGFRPRDADVTGGYYQPVRARVGGMTAFGMERITCNLADAPVDSVQEYLARYQANRNPEIASIAATIEGEAADLGAIPAGSAVTFELAWDAAGAEAFVVYDREELAIVDAREGLRVSWFATAGQFEHDRTGRDGDDPATSTTNVWTAPAEPGAVHVWAVLRDSRGGMDFEGLTARLVR